MAREAIVQRAWQELSPHLEEQGYELVEVEYARQGRRGVLRLFIDREGGVTLDDCVAVSQLLNPVLDMAGFVDENYLLEVSSPGIARPLRRAKDFERFTGERVKATAHNPVNGRKRFTGTLVGFEDGLLAIDCEGEVFTIHVENLVKAKLDR